MNPPQPPAGTPIDWLALTLVPGLSMRQQRALLQFFGSPASVLRASHVDVVRAHGEDVAAALKRGAPAAAMRRAERWLAEPNHQLVARGDAAYPALLEEIADPPSLLYVRGRCDLLRSECLAIVGSRNATAQGRADAEALGRALGAAGYTIVSGLALGIDAAAHRGGLAAGSSIAVLGTGADRVYPERNRLLADELARCGAIISEWPLGTPPLPGNFPQRNRLISGLSRGVLVVEAAAKSGSLTTARFALDQGREVFAVPGSIHSPVSKGCHELIKEGAKLVEGADDVLVELTGLRPSAKAAAAPAGEHRNPLLEAMGYGPVTVDQMAERTGSCASSIAADLSRLEIQGRVAALAGGLFQRLGRA